MRNGESKRKEQTAVGGKGEIRGGGVMKRREILKERERERESTRRKMETKQQQTLTHKRKSEQAIGLTEADIVVIQKVLQVLTRPRADFRAAALCSQTSGAGLCVSSKLVTASGSPREREREGGGWRGRRECGVVLTS